MSKEITVDGVVYVPKKSSFNAADSRDGMKYVIVRTYSAGAFAGYLESKDGQSAVMRDARRLWYWKGAASLSQLAMEGVKNPDECKFPCEVDRVELEQVIEVLDVSKEAQEIITNVPVWKA